MLRSVVGSGRVKAAQASRIEFAQQKTQDLHVLRVGGAVQGIFVRIPLMADTDSTFIADSIPFDGGHPAQVS